MNALNRACAAALAGIVSLGSVSASTNDAPDTLALQSIVIAAKPLAETLSARYTDAEFAAVPATTAELYRLEFTGYRSAFQGLAISTLSMLTLLQDAQATGRSAALLQLDTNADGRLDLLDFAFIERSGDEFETARSAFQDLSGTGWIGPYLWQTPLYGERDITGTGFDLSVRATQSMTEDRDITGTGFDLILDLGESMREDRDITGTGFDAVLEQLGRLQVNRDISGTGRVAADSFDILGQQVINAMNRLAADDVAGAGAELVLGYLAAAAMLTED